MNTLNIVIADLVSGARVIGKKTDEGLEKVFTLARGKHPAGTQAPEKGIPIQIRGLLAPFNTGPIEFIDKQHILYSCLANLDLADAYMQLTTGIAIPKGQARGIIDPSVDILRKS